MAAEAFDQISHLQEVILYLKAAVAAVAGALAMVWRWGSNKSKRLDESQEARIAAEQRHAEQMAAATERTILQAQTFKHVSEALYSKPKSSDDS